ncbi:hypothetical protein Kpol_1043p29 [Vanderwaltozyma polyspora DSM 70294]|uniref:Nuclear pore complex protein n=1 Tax=Vanderwaltozyma polyspora (strain ATCC 22028 / DSM 70294 / BCRC 21397 / CBS 2163 / NBRC 10782 / NRRL Y-8283 / UCD 57-17) TaxID=436907 RepID=A7TIP7_VANPO|nr:uncharacterized protein Kpol_1043p29 [Vanderwaltozyma polyspora DSM 70294]EDO17839.1 hypothetical protein Kpol_1043p29 [Vanderwaltozyma polyspora DSM 70294]
MEVDKDVLSRDCLVEFANALTDYRIEQFNDIENVDPFDIIRQFRSVIAKTSLQASSNIEGLDTVWNSDLVLEANFWHLVEILLSFRTSQEFLDKESSISSKPYNSSIIFEKELLQKDKNLYQIWLIIVWIEGNFPFVEKPSNIPSSKWTNTLVTSGLMSSDLDYPLRDCSVVINDKDKADDHVFYKYVYELLLCGNYDQIFEECKLSDNITLNMIMCGMQEYVDPSIDVQLKDEFEVQQGVKKHSLWRRAVYSLSQNDKLDKYERAIYSYLAGDIPNDEVLQTLNWDSELLVYLNQILKIEVENYLLQNGKVNNDELILSLPSNTMDLQSILNLLSAKHPEESEHPIRVLIGSVMLNTIPSVLHSSVSMLMNVVTGIENDNDIFGEPYLLRVVTHMTIFLEILNPGTISESDKTKLITAYISILKSQELYDLIPIYISFLSHNEAIEASSFILSNLEGKDIRKKQLEICNFLKLPVEDMLKRTTQCVFAETESEYTPVGDITISFESSDIDRHLILGVDWLIEGNLYEDAVESSIALSRRFLLNGKVKSLEMFLDEKPIDDLLKNYQLSKIHEMDVDSTEDTSVLEIQQYRYLINIFKQYMEWEKTVKLLNSESNIPSIIEKFQEFFQSTFKLIKTFLVDLTENIDHKDHDILFEIRALYTPYLIMELHKGLVEAASLLRIPRFIKDALNITNLVANEDDKIYLLFQSSGKLKEYLQLVAQTATLTP